MLQSTWHARILLGAREGGGERREGGEREGETASFINQGTRYSPARLTKFTFAKILLESSVLSFWWILIVKTL